MRKKPSYPSLGQVKVQRAKESAKKEAAEKGHVIGSWSETSRGLRGACLNDGCHGHIDLHVPDYDRASSPTTLKRSCPYRAHAGRN